MTEVQIPESIHLTKASVVWVVTSWCGIEATLATRELADEYAAREPDRDLRVRGYCIRQALPPVGGF